MLRHVAKVELASPLRTCVLFPLNTRVQYPVLPPDHDVPHLPFRKKAYPSTCPSKCRLFGYRSIERTHKISAETKNGWRALFVKTKRICYPAKRVRSSCLLRLLFQKGVGNYSSTAPACSSLLDVMPAAPSLPRCAGRYPIPPTRRRKQTAQQSGREEGQRHLGDTQDEAGYCRAWSNSVGTAPAKRRR